MSFCLTFCCRLWLWLSNSHLLPLCPCLSFFHRVLLPTVFFSVLLPFIFFLPLFVTLFVIYSLPPSSDQTNPSSKSLSRPRSGEGGRGGGMAGCSGWAFLLSLRWQRHRRAIDSSAGPHSLLMLECVILWQFSLTEIDCAELLQGTLRYIFYLFFSPQTTS